MPRLIWAPSALLDIARLHAFLASKNPAAAQRAVAAIRQGVKLLRQHPEVGKTIDRLPSSIRQWPIGFGSSGYLAFYKLENDAVVILAVRHGRELGVGLAPEDF